MYIKWFRVNNLGVSPVIAVILMVAITVVLSGLLWAILMNTDVNPNPKNITATVDDEKYYWIVEIAGVSSTRFRLDRVSFEVMDTDGICKYSLSIMDSHPDPIDYGLSTVYPLTTNTTVIDKNTGNPVTNTTYFRDYARCKLAYLDANEDYRISDGDVIYVFKDYNNDFVNDIKNNYELNIRMDDIIALSLYL
jgi:flagellin-like protein